MAKPEVFARRMFDLAQGLPENAARVLRRGAISAAEAVVRATPVDTALARSNWLAGLGSPDLSARAPRSIDATIAEVRSKVQRAPPDSEIHIANGGDKVPYLELLNAGSSLQAPANFVRIAAMVARESLLEGQRLLVVRRRG